MTWVCAQHGKECRSYVSAFAKELNAEGITPESFPASQADFKELVKWVKKE